ncbi:NACHT domain-containing protein [Paraburkholderia kururiensis]|uniref:NACHT domain-containing protein n=1 Tax=Paraburkholderia kururiensis TaxID=984307 RepID=UPI0018F55224|nr:NACHT domain-containing protein [Paraburkholderia kururiensis]
MTGTGAEIAVAVRVLTPLIKDLYEGGKDIVSGAFKKWSNQGNARKIARKIASVGNVKTIWQFDKEVPLKDFYYASSIIEKPNGKKKQANSIADLPPGATVIEGIVGQGKSIFLRYLCVQELSENSSGHLPVFIEFREMKPGQTLFQFIVRELKSYGLNADDDVFAFLASSGKLALLLDGFDELDGGMISDVVYELERYVNNFENITIIVTSRPDCDIQKSSAFHVTRLAMLDNSDYMPFLERLGLPKLRANEIVTAIQNSPSEVSQLINTPLMLTLTVTVYRSEKSIPPELPEFFEALFTTVFTRHDKTKPGFVRKHKTDIGERALQKFFEIFCFMAAQRGKTRTLTSEEFGATFEQAIFYSPDVKCSLEAFKFDMCKVACLLLEEGLGDVTFIHKSIAEYFAASFIKRQQEAAAQKFYEKASNSFEHWRDILKFLSRIDQYRYLRFYKIPSDRSTLEIFYGSQSHATDESIKEYIRRGVRNTTFLLANEARQPHLMGWRSTTITSLEKQLDGSLSKELLFSRFIDVIVKNIPPKPRDVPGAVVFDEDRARSRRVIEVPGTALVDWIGIDPFVKAIKVGMQEIERGLTEAVLAAEELKQNIF